MKQTGGRFRDLKFLPILLSFAATFSFVHQAGATEVPSLRIKGSDLKIEGELGSFKPSWEVKQIEENLMLATLTIESPQAAVPPAFDIKWNIPAVDIAGAWVSDYAKAKLDHERTRISSRAVQRAPLLMYISQSDNNRFTVALSDAMNPIMIRGGIKEEDCCLHMTVHLFKEKHPVLKKYQISLRFDTRPAPYYTVLRDTVRWWAAQDNYTPAPVPETARVPLYSTWYSYHQGLDPDILLEECRIGGKLGLEGIIVDDGWQTLDGNRGYAYTGDWKPERIPNMKGFVDRVHALNQKVFIWYSVPMAGEKSKVIKQFKGKTLAFSSGFGAYILDPRYPEVRDYLIGVYESAVRDWGLDGLKLDFIAMFSPKSNTVLTAEDGRDYASVDQAVDRLMTDVMTHLRAIKPDIAIEFRQPYNGPLMRKYGNMLRAVDCPNCAPVNRKHIVDLRLIVDNTAVHSDMIMWHPDEPVESAALQILNIIFSVPQISVRLPEVSEAHRRMIGFWMNYWKKNRAVLLDGEFQPAAPAQNYPMIVGRTPAKFIAAIYQNMVVAPGVKPPSQIDVVNGMPGGGDVVVRFSDNYGKARVCIYDTQGHIVSNEVQTIKAGATVWKVPPSGLLQIKRLAGLQH